MSEERCKIFNCDRRRGNYCCYYCRRKCANRCLNSPDRCRQAKGEKHDTKAVGK